MVTSWSLTERSAGADHANHPVVLGEAEASDSSSSLEELGPGEPGHTVPIRREVKDVVDEGEQVTARTSPHCEFSQ
jgi:hypothetical protein